MPENFIQNTANVDTDSLPSNIDAEQYIIGSILIDNELLDIVIDFLEPKHFFHLIHIKIYESMCKLFHKSLPIALPVLSSILENDADFIKQDGANYLSHLTSKSIGVIDPKSYAYIVYNLFLKRSLIAIGADLVRSINESDMTILANDYIVDLENKLFNLVNIGAKTQEFERVSGAIKTTIDAVDLARKNPQQITGISSGYVDLDKKLSGLQNSDLIIIAARPSMGKTALALNIGLKMVQNHALEKKLTVGFFSLEMSQNQLASRFLSIESGINSLDLKEGNIKEEQYNILREKASNISDNFFIDDSAGLHIAQLIRKAKRLKRQWDVDVIFIDYLQLIRTDNKYGSRVLEISDITQSLKALAKDLNIPLVVMSQLSRAVEQRQDKRPLLSDLRDSGTIEQDADIVMFLYREEYYLSRSAPELGSKEYENWQLKMDQMVNLAELHIAKNRNGPTGKVSLFFDKNIAKFDNSSKRVVEF